MNLTPLTFLSRAFLIKWDNLKENEGSINEINTMSDNNFGEKANTWEDRKENEENRNISIVNKNYLSNFSKSLNFLPFCYPNKRSLSFQISLLYFS